MNIADYTNEVFNSFFHKDSLVLIKTKEQIVEELTLILSNFKNYNEKKSFLLSISREFEDRVISKIKKQETKYGKAILNNSETFLQIFNWLNSIDLKTKTKTKSKSPKSIIRKDHSINLNHLVEFMHSNVFKESDIEDIKRLLTEVLEKPKSKLTLNISNKAFVYFLEELIDNNILIRQNLFGEISKIESIYSSNGKLLNRNNFDQAKNQLASGLANKKEELMIQKFTKSIRNNK